MSIRYSHNQEDINKAFEKIRVEELDNLPHSQNPGFMIIGGQSGAGKSVTIRGIKRKIPNLYIIDVDKIRKEHPQYAVIQRSEGIDAPLHTHGFAMALRDRIIDYLRDRQVDFALETTLGNTHRTLDLVNNPLWKHNGYTINVYMVAVPYEISEISVVKRYFDGRARTETIQGIDVDKRRYVPALARIKQYEGMPHTLLTLTATQRLTQ